MQLSGGLSTAYDLELVAGEDSPGEIIMSLNGREFTKSRRFLQFASSRMFPDRLYFDAWGSSVLRWGSTKKNPTIICPANYELYPDNHVYLEVSFFSCEIDSVVPFLSQIACVVLPFPFSRVVFPLAMFFPLDWQRSLHRGGRDLGFTGKTHGHARGRLQNDMEAPRGSSKRDRSRCGGTKGQQLRTTTHGISMTRRQHQ